MHSNVKHLVSSVNLIQPFICGHITVSLVRTNFRTARKLTKYHHYFFSFFVFTFQFCFVQHYSFNITIESNFRSRILTSTPTRPESTRDKEGQTPKFPNFPKLSLEENLREWKSSTRVIVFDSFGIICTTTTFPAQGTSPSSHHLKTSAKIIREFLKTRKCGGG